MIVQCDKCKTKFRIAEAKVTENGVRVRCSRCAHVFMVRRLGAPLPGRGAESPSGQHEGGPAPPSPATLTPSSLPAQSQGPYPIPSLVPSTIPTAGPAAFGGSTPSASDAARPRAMNIPKVATTQDAMVALGFAPAQVPFDEEPTAAVRQPFSPPPRTAPVASGETLSRPPPSLPPPPPPAEALDMLADPATVPSPPEVSELFDVALALSDPLSPGAHFAASSPAPAQIAMPPIPKPPVAPAVSYGEVRLPYAEAPPTHRDAGPSFADAFSYGEIAFQDSAGASPFAGSSPPPRTDGALPFGGGGSDSKLEFDDAFGSLTNPFFPPPPGLSGHATVSPGEGPPPAAHGHPENGGDLPDIPGLFPLGIGGDDPFAGLDLGASAGYSGGDLAPPMSDLGVSTHEPATGSSEGLRATIGRIDLGRAGMPDAEDHSATTRVASTLPLPAAVFDELPGKTSDRIGPWPTYVGFALGLLIVIMAVMGPARGELSKLGPGDIAALVSPRLTEPIVEAVAQVRPRDAHVTAYATRSGKKLLVVAGDAYNEGRQEVVGLEAIALVVAGREVVDRREAWVGLTIAEDALAAVETPADLQAAYANAMRSLPKPVQELALKSGATLPFMVVFPDPSDDLEHRSFHVEFRKGATGKSSSPEAARPK